MPMLSKISRINPTSTPAWRVNWIAMALPLAITVGCAGPQSRAIIDYTISDAEYQAMLEPAAEPEETIAEEIIASAAEAPDTELADDLLADTAATVEPVMAAATPAPVEPTLTSLEMNAEKGYAESNTTPVLDALQQEAVAEPELAAAIDIDSLRFTPGIYASAGLGASRLNPDTSADPGFTADDKIAAAGQIALGVDLIPFMSVEVHSADYGSAGLAPEGRVNYHMNGISALLYAGKKKFRRRGLNGYARVGFNQLTNTPVGNIPFIEQSTTQASFGLGAEYNTQYGLGLRAEAVAYDGDVQYGQLGLLYRMAMKPRSRPKLAKAMAGPELQAPQSAELKAPIPTQPSTYKLQPMQPMANHKDITLPRYTAEYSSADDCTSLNGTLNNVTFTNGSAELTYDASAALDNVASTLVNCADRQIIVSAHTDNSGSASANDALSKRRARAVAMHLASRGVDRNRMRAVAYGESRPITSNATHDGRTRNRRVELEVR